MEIIYIDINKEISLNENISACIGYFDGLHIGHQALINKAKDIAKKENIKSALITFYPDPKDIITNTKHKHIQSFGDRLKIIEKMGLDICIIFNFTKELCFLSKDDFYHEILAKLNIHSLVCGFDFHYGYKGEGDAYYLKEKALFNVEIIKEVLYLNKKVSSTRIREAIEVGDINLANNLLGYSYFNTGIVISGKQNGRNLGFPTANLLIDDEILYPKHGVYIGYVKVDDKIYKAMINIGNNPTIASNNQVTYEVNILDFNKDIYGLNIIVYLNKWIRNDIKFNDLNELVNQLKLDQDKAYTQIGHEEFIF